MPTFSALRPSSGEQKTDWHVILSHASLLKKARHVQSSYEREREREREAERMGNRGRERERERESRAVGREREEEEVLHYKLSAGERTVTRRAICLIISCCGF